MVSWLFVLGGICLFWGLLFLGSLLLLDILERTDRFAILEDWIKSECWVG